VVFLVADFSADQTTRSLHSPRAGAGGESRDDDLFFEFKF